MWLKEYQKCGGGCGGQKGAGKNSDLVLVSTTLESALGPVLWRTLFCLTSSGAPPHMVRNLRSQGDMLM